MLLYIFVFIFFFLRTSAVLHCYRGAHRLTLNMATTSSSPQPIESMVVSLQNLARTDSRINWGALDKFVKDKRQLDYKNWEETSQWAEELKEVIGSPDDEEFQCIFERVLKDGGWYEAQQSCSAERPWIVLVTGLNGVRKTTSLHQPWFKAVLAEALGDSFNRRIPISFQQVAILFIDSWTI